ncbi:MAG: chemotaxis protein CheW [Oligoflexia bacterium]|nr:chemotaxis protein CheW [Oligoflexia bacterium]
MSTNETKVTTEATNTGSVQRFLSFSLGAEEYAVPLLCVKEVIALPDVTPVPYTPQHFLGIMNLRGQVTSVIDLRLKFRMKKIENSSETAVIIADLAPLSLGLVVDSINSVMAIREGEIAPRPQIESTQSSEYIIGVAKREKKLVLLLDLAKALSVEDHAALSRAIPAAKAA